jgi:hypothetical protein
MPGRAGGWKGARMSKEVTGVGLHGDVPRRLSLSDGSRLLLDVESCSDGDVAWKRVGWRRQNGRNEVSVSEAAGLAGERFRDYVRIRTRSEAEWMEVVADWYAQQAARLRRELALAA